MVEFGLFSESVGAVVKAPTDKAVRVDKLPRRKYTPAEQQAFFEELSRIGSITWAARNLGFSPAACDKWAHKRGIYTGVKNLYNPKRDEYLALRRQGIGRRKAANQAGISRGSSYRWDEKEFGADQPRGAVPSQFSSGYKKEMPITVEVSPVTARHLHSMETEQGIGAVGRRPSISDIERVIHPRYLSLDERVLIADLLQQGISIRAIGRQLGRSASSISREVARNQYSNPGLGYGPYNAHRVATASRARPKTSKLATYEALRKYVDKRLGSRWSPEQISNALIKDFTDDPSMRVSPETIYQALYFQARGGLKREVQAVLRTGRYRRKQHKNPEERTPRFRDPMINISERPAEVEDRAIPGAWEGDLITGAYNQSAIATLVERQTRYVMLVHLPVDHTAESVRDGLIATMLTLPEHLRGSLTWDQGAEMAKHHAFSLATDMDVYFCDPASPWQRGTNENTNGLLRQYFPKGTDLSTHDAKDLQRVAQELNERPRKTLDWDTPAERLRDLLKAS